MSHDFDPTTADIRFGCGLSPVIAPPASIADMLAGIAGTDRMAQAYPIEGFDAFRTRVIGFQSAIRALKDDRNKLEVSRNQRREARADLTRSEAIVLLRRAHSTTPLRERLVQFWTDHFTAAGKRGLMRFARPTYVEEAIRPHVGGRFADMLVAAVSHPVMLHYLDQANAMGPSSAAARKRNRDAGLNENLAREILELHTLGVNGAYAQGDVQQLAELLTGLTYSLRTGPRFDGNRAEPGPETVLGKSYGGDPASADAIHAALGDLAAHPDTARHIAHKLAVHFVADQPDTGLVESVADAYLATRGDLMACYEALLTHPAAWSRDAANVKQPLDFVGSSLRALNVGDAFLRDNPGRLGQLLVRPLESMGHRPNKPAGPDGLPEADTAWVTPQSLAARLRWAMTVPIALRRDLPDPRDFAVTALGARLTPTVRFAAEAAETRWEAIGLVLASPAFQTM